MTSTASFDFIVVGAGTAGCVVAARLSTRATVLLLEAGADDTTPPHVHDVIADPTKLFDAIFATPGISKLYDTEPQAGFQQRRIPIHQATVRGGGSAINGMVYVRGNRLDYDLWEKLGNRGWGWNHVLPYFLKSERFAGGASPFHNDQGPLDISRILAPSAAALAFIDAAKQVFPQSDRDWDFNGAQQTNAAGLYHVNVTPGSPQQRASSATAFLDGVANASNLTVRLGTRVTRLVFEGTRVVGVACAEGTQEVEYRVHREVVISAGTFESPKLLMLSGIGPASHLKDHDIPTRVDLAGVGQNLHDHVEVLIYHPSTRAPGEAAFTAEAGLFLDSQTQSPDVSPDLQFHVLGDFPGVGQSPRRPDGGPPFLICPVLCKPQSRGVLRLRSADPAMLPSIDPNYLQSPADVQVLVRGIEWAEHLARLGELGTMLDRRSQPYGVPDPFHPSILDLPDTPAARVAFIRQAATTVWHPVGTCKMGIDPLAVVTPELQVRGVDGLRVADASIMPIITSGNTNAVCFMIGERCAAMIP